MGAFFRLRAETAAALRELRQAYGRDRAAPWIAAFLLGSNLALLALPVAIVALEVLEVLPDIDRGWAHPGEEASWAEQLNHMQIGLCGVFLLIAYLRRGQILYLAWALLFGFVLIDDKFQYHETYGTWLARDLDLVSRGGLMAVEQGELLAWALAGLALVPLCLRALMVSHGRTRGHGVLFFGILAALAFCAIGLDVVHSVLDWRSLTLLEDGGEMLILAMACLMGYLLALKRPEASANRARHDRR